MALTRTAARVTVAAVLGLWLSGAVHAAEHGDPYHTHEGDPCAIMQAVLESAPTVLCIAPPVTPYFTVQILSVPDAQVIRADVERRANTIRGPPHLST